MARASGGANKMRPLSWGPQTEKIPKKLLRCYPKRVSFYQDSEMQAKKLQDQFQKNVKK